MKLCILVHKRKILLRILNPKCMSVHLCLTHWPLCNWGIGLNFIELTNLKHCGYTMVNLLIINLGLIIGQVTLLGWWLNTQTNEEGLPTSWVFLFSFRFHHLIPTSSDWLQEQCYPFSFLLFSFLKKCIIRICKIYGYGFNGGLNRRSWK